MKKIKLGLFPKVVIAIAVGALLGLVGKLIPEGSVWMNEGFTAFIRTLKTFNVLFAQFLKFTVPLLVLGLVTPAIANLGKGAGKMLIFVIVVSYISTVCGALFSYGCTTEFFKHILTPGELSAEALSEKAFEPFFTLKIPPVCDMMTAIVLSFVVGLGKLCTICYIVSNRILATNVVSDLYWTALYLDADLLVLSLEEVVEEDSLRYLTELWVTVVVV